MSKTGCLLILMLCFPLLGKAQAVGNQEIATALVESCYRFQFGRADSLLQQARKPPFPLSKVESDLLEANLLWWKTISGNKDKKIRSRFFEVLDQAQKQLRKEKSVGLDFYLKQISVQGFRTRMAMLEESYTSGFFQLNHSLGFFQKLLGKEQQNPVLLVFNGLYHYYWAKSWENYFLLRPYLAFYPRGNQEKGLELLEQALHQRNPYVKTEAHYFLMKIRMDEKKPKQALVHAQALCRMFPQNAVFQYYQVCLWRQLGETAKATESEIKLLEYLKNNPQTTPEQYQHFKLLCQHKVQAASL